MRLRIALALSLMGPMVACDSMEAPIPDEAPTAPSKEDSAGYSVTGARSWYLIGDDLTPGNDTLELAITAPADTDYIDLWLDGQFKKRARPSGGQFKFSLDIASMPAGEHRLLLAADGEGTAFAARTLKRSAPLYVAVSNDWDTSDHTDDKLERQERLHANHEHLVITHFVGPYTFTDPALPASRQQHLVNWVKKYEQQEGDEIGLHVHPWCHFVQAAGVTCKSTPSFAKTSDPTGYTVILGSYSQPELEKMFAKAASLFVANGLPKPTSFRAGGWTSTIDVVRALAKNGHVTDASAANWAKLEEWEFVADAALYSWNRENWAPIDEESQPYYPNEDDILADAPPHLPILEVPDNGALVDYVSTNEMVDMFKKNFDGRPLAEARQYSIGYHPVNFSESFFVRIDGALAEIDKHLAVDDRGPVIYARMSDLPKAFPRPTN